MKYYYFLLVITYLVTVKISYSYDNFDADFQVVQRQYKDTTLQEFVVEKITKVKNGYVILIYNSEDSLKRCFNLVTLKCRINKKSKIKVGDAYLLKIYPYFENDMFLNIGLIYEIEINGKIIRVPPNKWRSNVYISQDLKGLNYVRR